MTIRLLKSCRRAAVVFILVTAAHRPAVGQNESVLRLGMHLEKNAVLLPGFEISYAHTALLNGRPRLSLSYASSRLSTVLDQHGLIEDRFLLGMGWHFRQGKRLAPYARVDFGFTRFGREDPDIFALLDNDAVIVAAMVGLEVRLFDSRFSLSGDAGYSIIQSSTVYPLVTSLGIHYTLRPRAGR